MTHHLQKSWTWIGFTVMGLSGAIAILAGISPIAPTTQASSPFMLANLKQSLSKQSLSKQSLSLSGTLYRYEPAIPKASPPPLPGYRVYLYSRESNRWIGPSITDSYGRYAFYDISSATYLLRIYPTGYRGELNKGQSTQSAPSHIWQQEVKVPGRVKPIVLQRPTD